MRVRLPASLLILIPATLAAETIIPAADLQADLGILRSAYEQLHPGLYRYNSKAQMDANFDLLSRELSRPQTLSSAFLAIARFTAKVKCGHTYPNFYNQKPAIANEVFGGQTRLPFEFTWIGGDMVITRNLSGDPALEPGTRITKINGVTSKKVVAELLKLARADGSNTNKRLEDLSITGLSRFPAFDVYYPLIFPLKDFSYRLTASNGNTHVVSAWTLAQRTAALRGASVPEGDQPVWTPTMLDEKTAYLRMSTWALYNSKWKWKEFLHGYIDELISKNTPKLIIDLRGNEGGLDCGNIILSRLIDKDLSLTVYRRKVRYRKTPSELNQYLETWDPSFRDWGADAIEDNQGFYRLAETAGEDSPGAVKPRAPRYNGRVIVLMDAANSSATFQFEGALKRNKLATLIGEPAGGNLRGINGGAFFFLRLPKSGIEVDLPLIGRFPDEPQPDGTLAPDILIRRTAEDLQKGVDAALAAARRL